MARLLSALIVIGMVAGCTSGADPTTSTTATSLPPTSTTAATTSTTTTSTTLGSTTSLATTTTVPAPLTIVLSGGDVAYTIDGTLVVEGWVDRPAEVTVGGTPTSTHTEPSGRTGFFAELTDMDVGTYEIPIEAMAGDDTATVMLTVVHDPDLEREFAYLAEVDAEAGLVVADYAQWFTGEAAEQAAAEDGNANPDGTVDGGFYIRNVNPRLRTLDVADDTTVVLHACYVDGPCLTREPVPFGTFAVLTADPDAATDLVGWQWYGSGYLPYWLLIDDGTVIHIDEHYLP